MNIYRNIECDLHERVMIVADTPFQITARTRAVLQKVEHRDLLVVHRLAGELAYAIALKRICKNGDMVDVIVRQSAMLEEMIAWLGLHDIDARSLRYRRTLKAQYPRHLRKTESAWLDDGSTPD